MMYGDHYPNPHTCAEFNTPSDVGGYWKVWAVRPGGLRDALRVLFGRYEARVWVRHD